jgi:hypothetical protein
MTSDTNEARPESLRPEATRVRAYPPVEGWTASASGLLDWVRSRATPLIVREVARGEDGYRARETFAILANIVRTGRVPRSLGLMTCDALRWQGVIRNHDRFHTVFSCALRNLTIHDECNCEDAIAESGIHLVESSPHWGDDVTDAVARFFAWRAETAGPRERALGVERPMSLVLLFLLSVTRDPDDPRLGPLSEQIAEHPAVGRFAEWLGGTYSVEKRWQANLERTLEPHRDSRRHVGHVLHAIARTSGAGAEK